MMQNNWNKNKIYGHLSSDYLLLVKTLDGKTINTMVLEVQLLRKCYL